MCVCVCVCVCERERERERERDIISLDIQTKFGVGWGNPTARAGEVGSIPGSGRSPEEKKGNPFQYSCLENPTDRETWWATVHEVPMSRTPTQRSILSLQGGYKKPLYQSVTLRPAFPHDSSKQNKGVPSLHRHMLSIWPQFPPLAITYSATPASQLVLVVKNPPDNAGNIMSGFDHWVGKIPWRRIWQATPVFLPGESHGQRSLAGCSP